MSGVSRDVLAEWQQRVLEMKYRLARPLAKVFKDTIETAAILRDFFNVNDYSVKPNVHDKDNYLIHLLASSQIKDIHLLNEIAELLKLSKSINHDFEFKSKSGNVNHASLSNALFEVHIDKYLRESGIQTMHNVFYTDSQGRKKPLDNFFIHNNEEYLVECCRVSDTDSVSLMALNVDMLRFFAKHKIHHYHSFIAHIGIKQIKELPKTINKINAHIKTIYKKYLLAFEVLENDKINIPGRFESAEYDLDISPELMANSHEKEMNKKDYYTLLTIGVTPSGISSNFGRLIIKGKRHYLPDIMNNRLLDKVKRKLDQHRDYEGNKLVFIEIDLTFGMNPNNPVFTPIQIEDIKTAPYEKLIKEHWGLILVLIFKKATNNGINRAYQVFYNSRYQDLVSSFAGNTSDLLNTKDFMLNKLIL